MRLPPGKRKLLSEVPYFKVSDTVYLNVFQVLAHTNYRGLGSDKFKDYFGEEGQRQWRKLCQEGNSNKKNRLIRAAEAVLEDVIRSHSAVPSLQSHVQRTSSPHDSSHHAVVDADVDHGTSFEESEPPAISDFGDIAAESESLSAPASLSDHALDDDDLLPETGFVLPSDEVDLAFSSAHGQSGLKAVNSRCRRLKFSEMFVDFCVDNCIPRLAAERWIRDLKRENPVFDIDDMPLTWKTLAKLPPDVPDVGVDGGCAELRHQEFSGLMSGPPSIDLYFPPNSDPSDKKIKPFARYVNFGLFKRVRRVVFRVLKATYPDVPEEELPACPHLLIELWIDGVSPFKSGTQNAMWPVCIGIHAISGSPDGPKVLVPARARKPITIGVFMGPRKPKHPRYVF